MTIERARKDLEEAGVAIQEYDPENRIYAGTSRIGGRTLYGTMNNLHKRFIGY